MLAPGEFDQNLSIQRLMKAETRYHPLRIPDNSYFPWCRTITLAPGEFDPDLSIQRLMNAETRYHPLRIPEKIYMQIKYNIYNETEPPWMVKFMADAQRIIDMRRNETMYFNFATGKMTNTYVPKRVFHRRKNYFLHGPPTPVDPNLSENYWTHYLKDFEPNSRGEIIVGGWKKKEVITRGPKKPDLRLKGARAKLAEMDLWGIYAHLLTPKPKIKWTPNIMKPDFNFDHQAMFDPPEENTVWILPATKSWEEFEIEDPRATTKRVHVPAWLQGEGLDPKKRGKGGMFNFEGRTYRDWEVPVKYRSLSPDLASKYYMIFDDKGRKIVPNQTLPARWGTNLPYGRTFTYRMDITNDDGTINKTIWKRNAGYVTRADGSVLLIKDPSYVTRADGSILLIKDLSLKEKLKYLGHIDRKDIVRRVELVTHPDGSLNYSTVVEEALRDVTYPTAWVNYTAANGSLLNRLWKYVKPTTTTKAYSRKYFAENEPTETVRYTFANGSLDRVFWKFAKYTMPPKSSGPRRRTGTSEVHITPPTQYIDEAHKYADRVAPHKKFELVTYADGGYKNITEYVPQVYNRTAIDGSYLYSYFYVPKYLRENSSGTENRKIITNIYGELVKTVTYRPKLYFLHTKSDGSFNHSEKVSDFELLKKQYYGHFQTVFHRFPNGSVERMHYDNVEGFTTPHINKYFGFAETTLLNFTRSDGAVLGTFWKIIKNVAKYTGTGSTILFKQTNRRGTLQHSFWRELRPFTNRDDRIKENDATEIRYVTRKGGFLYGSFKKKVRVYTTPVFRPYTGNLSTRTGE
ncbi:hypothetical protein M8J77_022731 [Diaphorina citri]|nr:hypothetical protein M8J77_022731 [Diaphorina citri]